MWHISLNSGAALIAQVTRGGFTVKLWNLSAQEVIFRKVEESEFTKFVQQQSLSGVCKKTFPDYVDHIKATFLGRVQFLAIYCSIAIILTSARTFGRDFSEIWVNVRLRISTDVRLGLRICTELLHNLLHKMFKCFS